ncbi:hypothetical protein RUND412_000939 [Rhizina undulata]
MDPFSLACGVAGFVGLIPPLITVCTQGYGMLSAAHNVGKDWKDLEWRRKILETRFNDWKHRVQFQDGGLAASLKADHKKSILVEETLAKIVECFRNIDKLQSKYRGRIKDGPNAISSSLFRALAIAAAPVIPITSSPTANEATDTHLHFPSPTILQDLLQLGQKDEAEVQKAIDQFHKDAREFQKAVSTRNQVRWALSGKDRLTQAVDDLEKYTNGVFEITKDMTPVAGPLISNTPTGVLNTSFKEYNVRAKLPFRRNPKFSGREDALDRLCQILELNNQADTSRIGEDGPTNFKRKTAILHGLGGMGKSQIALEYAHRFSRFCTAIFWIDADDISRTTDSARNILEQLVAHYKTKWRSSPDLQEIVNILGVAGTIDSSGRLDNSATDAAMKTVHNWLSVTDNRGWLLLVDNYDKEKDDQLDDLLPACDWGSVIITTRLPNLTRFGECVEVVGIGAEAGLNLLLKSSGKPQPGLDESELGKAQEIVEVLGQLPLALDQAGAYISYLRISFSVYRERIRKGLKDLFNKKLPGRDLSSAKASILTTWELSFQELSEDARHLLHLCSFLSNEDIPEELFRRGQSAVPWMEDENRLNDAIGNLFAFSLIQRKDSSDSLWMHPLVHSWTYERASSTLQRQYAEDAMTLVASAINNDQYTRTFDDWIFERRILSHLNVCQEHVSTYITGSDSIKVAEAASAIASAYRHLAYYTQAEELYQVALAGFEKELRKDHTATLDTVQNLAIVFDNRGQYDKALECYQKVLAEKEKGLGKDHISTLDVVHNMAIVFHNQGRYDEALQWCQRALAGCEKALGKDHPSTLDTVYHMAIVFHNQGRYDEALQWYQRALAGFEKALGKDHPSTLNTVDNMAMVFDKQERYAESLEWSKKALAGYEKALGKDHPLTLNTVDNMAITLRNMERYDEAEQLEKQYNKPKGECR